MSEIENTIGWGQGSVNNTNGWGAGAINNEIGWGDSHFKSWSGDTDIDGGTGIPVNTVAPVISGTTTLGSVLTTTNGTWTAKPTATFTYQWKRNGSNIVGATNSTYTLVNDDGATNITCQVTATNDFGSASATSNTLAIPAFTDADAQAFITAASITDPTQQSAINTLVTDLKGYGLWTKMKAIYPFVGGTASSHKFNLKDPRDLDAAFRLVFNGGVTHSSTGVTFNGTNGYGNTGLNPTSALTLNNTHLSFYSRTNGSLGVDLGATSTGDTSSLFIAQNYFSSFYADSYSGTSRFILPLQTSGLLTISRTANNSFKAFKNATQIGSTITSTSGSLPNWNLFLGATNLNGATNPTAYSARNIAFATIGDGLTDTDLTNLNSKITTFQTTLNRQV